MKRSWKIIAGIIAGLMVALVIIWLSPIGRFILTGGLSTTDEPFNSEKWKAVKNSSLEEKRVRLLMMDELMDKLEDGLDSTRVKEMLGEPEREFGFSYELGALTEGIDPFFLIIEFDASGKIERKLIQTEDNLKKVNK